jgi:Domain of unknown function (DUF4399)
MELIFGTFATALFLATGGASLARETPSAPDAKVYFINLKDGDVVKSPFLVQFGLSGMGIAPASTKVENTGHHHLLINTAMSKAELLEPVPMDDNHRHFGKGQTEILLELAPGKHTLQMLLGDWTHIAHVPPVMSDVITVTVD